MGKSAATELAELRKDHDNLRDRHARNVMELARTIADRDRLVAKVRELEAQLMAERRGQAAVVSRHAREAARMATVRNIVGRA